MNKERESIYPLQHRLLGPLFLLIGITLLSQALHAQGGKAVWDIGGYLGATGYTGDINLSPLPRSVGANAGFLLRYEINEMYAVRLNGNASWFHDYYKPERYYLPSYPAENSFLDPFHAVLLGLDANIEIHFHKFQVNDFCGQRVNKRSFAPYASFGAGVGLALFTPNSTANALFYIPMGLGFKFAVGGRLTLAPEIKFLKLFSDRPDGYSNWPIDGKDFNWHNRDWVSHVSLTIAYRLLTNVQPCPAYMR